MTEDCGAHHGNTDQVFSSRCKGVFALTPWTTAYYTDDWGVGETHGYRLPAKWISADGTQAHIVFSGRAHEGIDYDAFCVRRMALELFEAPLVGAGGGNASEVQTE